MQTLTARVDNRLTAEDLPPLLAALHQLAGRLLELLVFQEPPDQLGPRVFACLILLVPLGFNRQQHPGLDVDQRGRHHQELAGDRQVQRLHRADVVEVLLGDQRDRDVVDVDLVLLDQMQQEVQRTLELIQSDAIGVLRHIETDVTILCHRPLNIPDLG